jgi:hypothetical protein
VRVSVSSLARVTAGFFYQTGKNMNIKFRTIASTALALKAVESDGDALRYVAHDMRTEAVVLKAVESDGDALQYVLNKELFISIAKKLNINVEVD